MARERRIGDGARQQADAPLRDRHVAVARRHLLHLREARIECQPATAHALRHRCVSVQAQTSCHQVERRPICAPLHCLSTNLEVAPAAATTTAFRRHLSASGTTRFPTASAPPRVSDGLEHRFEEDPLARSRPLILQRRRIPQNTVPFPSLSLGPPGASVQSGAVRAGSRMHRVARARRR